MTGKTRLKLCSLLAIVIALSAGWFALRKRDDAQERNILPAEAYTAITQAEELTLFSIDPEMKILTTEKPRQNRDIPDNGRKTRLQKMGIPKEQFHGHDVLGEIDLNDPAKREAIAAHLKQGLLNWTDGLVGACFNPRHALRAEYKGATYEFLICFECGYLHYFPAAGEAHYLNMRIQPGIFAELLDGE